MPMGRAKFGPVPDWMAGTMARTRIPFIPARLMVSLTRVDMEIPTKWPATRVSTQKTAMITVGRPISPSRFREARARLFPFPFISAMIGTPLR
jgi:hypothetical protein